MNELTFWNKFKCFFYVTLKQTKEFLKIARLYYDMNELQEAKHYLASYLSEYSLDPCAWKLQAEICESESNWSKAVEYYAK